MLWHGIPQNNCRYLDQAVSTNLFTFLVGAALNIELNTSPHLPNTEDTKFLPQTACLGLSPPCSVSLFFIPP